MFVQIELIWMLILLLYFGFDTVLYFSFFKIKSHPSPDFKFFPLSVIIAAKNEEVNLKENLTSILNQDYPDFEVIVVDDQSQDNTQHILKTFSKHHPHLKYLKVSPNISSSKKTALDLGINSAQHNHLVFTDADCKPFSNKWLESISQDFSAQHTMILGFSPYQKKSGLLNQIIRFETLQTALNYFSFANLGLAYMGVGRNLAYTKKLYQKTNGFESHKHVLSGDDDLFVNQVAQNYKIGLCLDRDSFVESKPKTDFKVWINQKRRHITTASHYRFTHKFLLSFQYLIRVLFWVLILPLTLYLEINSDYKLVFISSLFLLLIIKMWLNRKIFKILSSQDLWFSAYLYEIVLICLHFYIFTQNIFSPKKTW